VRHATFSLARRGPSAHEKRLKVRELELESSVKNRKHSLVTDAMVLLSKTFHASCSVGLAAALVAAIPPGRMARAENIIGGAFAPDLLDAAASEGAFRHLRALQDIASESGGNRAAGTLGYDRSAEYVAERLKEAGYWSAPLIVDSFRRRF
jgi:hypothetical protein